MLLTRTDIEMLIFVESNLTCRAQANNKFCVGRSRKKRVRKSEDDDDELANSENPEEQKWNKLNELQEDLLSNWRSSRHQHIPFPIYCLLLLFFLFFLWCPFISIGNANALFLCQFMNVEPPLHTFAENRFVGILIFACAWHSYVTATSLGPLLRQILFIKKKIRCNLRPNATKTTTHSHIHVCGKALPISINEIDFSY